MLSAITKPNSNNNSFTSKPLTGISRYYHRRRLDQHGASYYVEPRELCPLSVLNDEDRFLVVTFDHDDDYLVIANHRVYLTPTNSIKCTSNVECRLAVIDLDELEHAKSTTSTTNSRTLTPTFLILWMNCAKLPAISIPKAGPPGLSKAPYMMPKLIAVLTTTAPATNPREFNAQKLRPNQDTGLVIKPGSFLPRKCGRLTL